MTSLKHFRLAAVGFLSLALAACAGGANRPSAPVPAASSASELDAIVGLLEQGDEGSARKKLKAVLKRDPMNPTAQLLKDSIERDPKDLLGPDSYAYKVRPGDTLSGLSQRLLGNRLKWYQLGRYNELKAPFVVAAGQTLRIPGQPPAPPPTVKPREMPKPAPDAAQSRPAPKPTASAPHAVTNPAAARGARAAGLASLNQGNVARAVQQLRRAAALDPGNALIARDLARAERIARTVSARK